MRNAGGDAHDECRRAAHNESDEAVENPTSCGESGRCQFCWLKQNVERIHVQRRTWFTAGCCSEHVRQLNYGRGHACEAQNNERDGGEYAHNLFSGLGRRAVFRGRNCFVSARLVSVYLVGVLIPFWRHYTPCDILT